MKREGWMMVLAREVPDGDLPPATLLLPPLILAHVKSPKRASHFLFIVKIGFSSQMKLKRPKADKFQVCRASNKEGHVSFSA